MFCCEAESLIILNESLKLKLKFWGAKNYMNTWPFTTNIDQNVTHKKKLSFSEHLQYCNIATHMQYFFCYGALKQIKTGLLVVNGKVSLLFLLHPKIHVLVLTFHDTLLNDRTFGFTTEHVYLSSKIKASK